MESKQAKTASQQQVREELIKQMKQWSYKLQACFDFETNKVTVTIPNLCDMVMEKISVKGWRRFFKPYTYSISYETISFEISKEEYEALYNEIGQNKMNQQ